MRMQLDAIRCLLKNRRLRSININISGSQVEYMNEVYRGFTPVCKVGFEIKEDESLTGVVKLKAK